MFTCEVIGKAAKPSDIEALAAKLEPALAKAVRDLLQDHVARVDLDALEEAIKSGQTWKVLDIVGSVDPVKAGAVKDALQNAVWAGGGLAAAQEPVFREVKFAFNRLNPALLRWIEGYELNLIRDVNDKTREAVRQVLTKGMREGRNPIDQARAIKTSVGLTPRDALAVDNYEAFLKDVHNRRSVKAMGLGNERSTVSGVAVRAVDEKGRAKDGINQWRSRDLRYDPQIKRAMETKTPLKPEQIAKMRTRFAERLLQNRSRTIARAENIRTLNVGVHEAWRQAIEDRKVRGDLVRKFWRDSKTERECMECIMLAKEQPKRGIGFDEYFISSVTKRSYKLAPAHPNCLCSVRFRLFEAEQLLAEAA